MMDHHVPSANQSLLSGFEPVGDDGPPEKDGPWYWPTAATSAAPAWPTCRPRRVVTATRAKTPRRIAFGTKWDTQRAPVEREDSDTGDRYRSTRRGRMPGCGPLLAGAAACNRHGEWREGAFWTRLSGTARMSSARGEGGKWRA